MINKYIDTERANLFEPNVYITMLVSLRGNIAKAEIYRAVQTAYRANETTMSKIVLEERGTAFYERMENSGCKTLYDNRSWETIMCESEKNPFAIHDGELIRTFIIERTRGEGQEVTVQLLICAHHLVGDGKSIVVLLRDIVDSLQGKKPVYKPMVLIDKDFLANKSKLPTGVWLAVKMANRKWEKTERVFTWEDYYDIHRRYWEKQCSDVEMETYSLEVLKKKCPRGVTLNSYLITELLRQHSGSKMVGIPLSIREENAAMSNQTSGISVKCRYCRNQSFEKNCRRIHKGIYKKLQNEKARYFVLLFTAQLSSTLLDSVVLQTHGCYRNRLSEKMARIMGYIGNRGSNLGVTNLTKIDLPYECDKFTIEDVVFIPPKVSYSKSVIGIVSYGDRLTVCHHGMKATE